MSNLSSEYRRRIVMSSEGAAISAVGANGAEIQSEITRAQIDGLFNALIRIDGPEVAAGYAFTMGDRVAAGLREPTDFRLPKPVLVERVSEHPAHVVLAAEKLSAKANRVAWWSAYLLGVIQGAIGICVLAWIIGKVIR